MKRFEPSPRSDRWKFRGAGLCALALATLSAPALGGEAAPLEKRACQTTGNALTEIGCELRRSISLVSPTLVVAGPPTADATLNQPGELARRVARVVSGSMGEKARHHPEAVDLARAQSLAREPGTLLYLSIEIAHGKIRVTGDVYRVKKNFWDRVKDREPTPTQHGFAERALDPEVRSFLPFVPVVAKVTGQAVPPERAPVALACGDPDHDGSAEIAFVGRHRVFLGRIQGKRFVIQAERSWSSLSPVAPAPLREPIAAAWFRPDGTLDVGSSDRARFVRLNQALEPVATSERRIPWAGGCAEFDATGVTPRLIPCLKEDPPPASLTIAGSLDSVTTEEGNEQSVAVAARDARTNEVIVHHARIQARLKEAGAQLAVSDLNGDGQLELVSSKNTHDPRGDALAIHTLTADGKLERKVLVPVNEGITALTVCPQPSEGLAPVLVGTRTRLWVVR